MDPPLPRRSDPESEFSAVNEDEDDKLVSAPRLGDDAWPDDPTEEEDQRERPPAQEDGCMLLE